MRASSAWHAYWEKLHDLLAQGRRDDAVTLFMAFVGAPTEMIEGMRQSPMWAAMEAVAPTLAYDAAALGIDRTVPVQRAAAVTASTLVMDGEASEAIMPFMRASADALAKAIPGAKHRTLEGQRHDVDERGAGSRLDRVLHWSSVIAQSGEHLSVSQRVAVPPPTS